MSAYKTLSEEKKQYSRTQSLKWYHANKEKAAEKAKKWRLNNLEYIKTKQREDKRARKLWAIDYLGGKCCSCNLTYHPSVYEFHHIDPTLKDRDPSKMLQLSLSKLQVELDKCLLLCANCHRLHHHGDIY